MNFLNVLQVVNCKHKLYKPCTDKASSTAFLFRKQTATFWTEFAQPTLEPSTPKSSENTSLPYRHRGFSEPIYSKITSSNKFIIEDRLFDFRNMSLQQRFQALFYSVWRDQCRSPTGIYSTIGPLHTSSTAPRNS